MFDLTGKTILITGGAGFLAGHFVPALSQAGAQIILADIAQPTVSGTNILTVHMDVTDPVSVADGFAKGIERFNRIDVVVNNAAVDPKFDTGVSPNQKLFEHYPAELLKKSLEVNILGALFVSQHSVKHMLEHGGGHIINISSIYGEVGPDQRIYPEGTQKPVDYAVTKGATKMLTKWLATTYGEKGIRANTYTLGGVFKGHSDDFVKEYAARTPLGRMVDPHEIGEPLVFLASDAAVGMTGANLVVDGGWTAW